MTRRRGLERRNLKEHSTQICCADNIETVFDTSGESLDDRAYGAQLYFVFIGVDISNHKIDMAVVQQNLTEFNLLVEK